MANLFAAAKTVAAKTPAAKKAKVEQQMIGVKQYAELKALQGSIAALLGTMEAELKAAAFEVFIEKAAETHKSPESFDGVEDIASVNMQMRKRGTNSPLSESELEVLEAAGINAFEETIVAEMFGINPIYSENSELLGKVSSALENIVPEDFIVKQEKKSKKVVSTDTVTAAFAMGQIDPTVIKIVTTMAMKPKLTVVDIDAILTDVRDLIGSTMVAE